VGRGSWVVGRGSWVVGRGSWVVGRGSWVVGRGSWVVGRGSWVVGRQDYQPPIILRQAFNLLSFTDDRRPSTNDLLTLIFS
jgi:hypothetical protein